MVQGKRYSTEAFITFCGSINILKYVFINCSNKLPISAIISAVKSGSEEIIEFFVNHEISLDNMLWHAVQYHHNKIAIWLHEHYSDPQFHTMFCVRYCNTEMLLYFMEKGEFSFTDNSYLPPLHTAAELNNSIIARLLILKGADPNATDYLQQLPIRWAQTKEMRNIVMC